MNWNGWKRYKRSEQRRKEGYKRGNERKEVKMKMLSRTYTNKNKHAEVYGKWYSKTTDQAVFIDKIPFYGIYFKNKTFI